MAGQIFIEAPEMDVAGQPVGAKLLYPVFRDTNGEEYVIRSGPQNSLLPWIGPMKIEANVPIAASGDARGSETPANRASTPLDFPGLSDDQAWAVMVKYAHMIDAADTPYELLSENSNALSAPCSQRPAGLPKRCCLWASPRARRWASRTTPT
jgi:hypothetical protein